MVRAIGVGAGIVSGVGKLHVVDIQRPVLSNFIYDAVLASILYHSAVVTYSTGTIVSRQLSIESRSLRPSARWRRAC